MSRAIVNVATGPYVRGQQRMKEEFGAQRGGQLFHIWANWVPVDTPPHSEVPYAFKAFALAHAAKSTSTLLWCDACIRPGARPLNELWEKIERDGVWIGNNGFTNYEWTADSAYPDLFAECLAFTGADASLVTREMDRRLAGARRANRTIPHVVATAFGISTVHPKGKEFLDEYLRLAKTKAFCGPWTNGPKFHDNPRQYPCGPGDVRGHRHDQTAASVIAWRLGVELTNSPEWFAYAGGETDKTCLIADGAY